MLLTYGQMPRAFGTRKILSALNIFWAFLLHPEHFVIINCASLDTVAIWLGTTTWWICCYTGAMPSKLTTQTSITRCFAWLDDWAKLKWTYHIILASKPASIFWKLWRWSSNSSCVLTRLRVPLKSFQLFHNGFQSLLSWRRKVKWINVKYENWRITMQMRTPDTLTSYYTTLKYYK